MKATEKYFTVVLCIMLYKMVLTFESVDETLKCDHLNESSEQYLPVFLLIMLFKEVSNFWVLDEILRWTFWVALSKGAVLYAVEGGAPERWKLFDYLYVQRQGYRQSWGSLFYPSDHPWPLLLVPPEQTLRTSCERVFLKKRLVYSGKCI